MDTFELHRKGGVVSCRAGQGAWEGMCYLSQELFSLSHVTQGLWSMSHTQRSPVEAVFCCGPGMECEMHWVRDGPVLQQAVCDCSVCGLATLNGNVLLDIMDI